MTTLAPSMQAYFTDRLISQRQASPNTIAAYRHTFRLLLRFALIRGELDEESLARSELSLAEAIERQAKNQPLAAVRSSAE